MEDIEKIRTAILDILVRFYEPPLQPLGFVAWGRLERELSRRCGCKVDLVPERSLKRHLRPYIEAEKLVLYEQAR